MLKKEGTLWILDESFCSVDQKHTKSKMDTDSNTEKGKRSLIHVTSCSQTECEKKNPPTSVIKKSNTNHMEIKILHTKLKTDTDSNTEKGTCSLQGFNIFTHY